MSQPQRSSRTIDASPVLTTGDIKSTDKRH